MYQPGWDWLKEVSLNGGTPSHHPFSIGIFHEINHPAMGLPPWLWKPPYAWNSCLLFGPGQSWPGQTPQSARGRTSSRTPSHAASANRRCTLDPLLRGRTTRGKRWWWDVRCRDLGFPEMGYPHSWMVYIMENPTKRYCVFERPYIKMDIRPSRSQTKTQIIFSGGGGGGENGRKGKLGSEGSRFRWEFVMFLFNVVNLNVWLFLFDYFA